MFETSMNFESPIGAVEMLIAIAVSALLIILVVGFIQGTVAVQPSDLNLARFGGI